MCYKSFVWAISLISIIISGCAATDSMESKLKAPASQGTGFVTMQQMAKRPDLPFDKVWVKQGVDWQRYKTIYITPVNTDYLMKANWWQQTIRPIRCSRTSRIWRPSCA